MWFAATGDGLQGLIDFGDDSLRRFSRIGVFQDRPADNEIIGAESDRVPRSGVPLVIIGGSTRRPDPRAHN
jgi:hypothetical protein